MIIALKDKPSIESPNEVFSVLHPILKKARPEDQDKEHFWVFYLNARHKVKALELVSLGTLTSSLVHPREVFTLAITHRCATIVLAHNHPSGDPEPSSDDISITNKLVDAGEILGIEVMDHVIVAGDSFTSLRQLGMI